MSRRAARLPAIAILLASLALAIAIPSERIRCGAPTPSSAPEEQNLPAPCQGVPDRVDHLIRLRATILAVGLGGALVVLFVPWPTIRSRRPHRTAVPPVTTGSRPEAERVRFRHPRRAVSCPLPRIHEEVARCRRSRSASRPSASRAAPARATPGRS